jgi:hypothetical protein
MAEIKYQYAYDENGLLVSISDLSKESSKQHSFRCVSCGSTLLPRAIESKHRKPHFYHKSVVDCSGETYLHKLGKLLIKKKFDYSEKFVVSYSAKIKCNKSNCNLHNKGCEKQEEVKVDLKEFYDTCSVEAYYKGFIADLLLTNSQKPDTPPVFIEIFVSHACDDDKLDSGFRIIEIPIRCEQDLKDIEAEEELSEAGHQDKRKKGVRFYSFKKEFEAPMSNDVTRFVFCSNQNGSYSLTTITCADKDYKLLQESQTELNLVSRSGCNNISQYYALKWMEKSKSLRCCEFCKFYEENNGYCRLSKKYGKPEYPDRGYAENCGSYYIRQNDIFMASDDDVYVEEVFKTNKAKSAFRVIIAGGTSFSDYELFKNKCNHYLSYRIEKNVVIILSGTSLETQRLIERYAEEKSLLVEHHNVDWEDKVVYDRIHKSHDEMLQKADALIAFYDGKAKITHSLIEKARLKGIQVAVVSY